MNKPKIIAFYLPQYHPTPHNDEWWGKGFTEWTNVAKAKPLFRGHEQPHIPGELGFYDLRLPEVREAQAELAKEYGIYGFCYYYYRFEKGKNELELPLNEVLKSGKPDFPFMICWANESWHKKFWNYDGTCEKQILAEQKYKGTQDYIDFFYEVLPLFKDKRYITIAGKPAFMVYKPNDFPDVSEFIVLWNNLAKENGLAGIHFIASATADYGLVKCNQFEKHRLKNFIKNNTVILDVQKDKEIIMNYGFDAIALNRFILVSKKQSFVKKVLSKLHRFLFKSPAVFQYEDAVKFLVGGEDADDDVYPVVIPNWDHTPRSKYGGIVWHNSTPDIYNQYLTQVLKSVNSKNNDNKIVFLKAWNEWGEGNYVEPDLKWGRKYLEATKNALESLV